MNFVVKSHKNCVRYTRKVYQFSRAIDQNFLEEFGIFGDPEITEVKQFLPKSNDLLKIRNYEFSFEITGGLNGKSLSVIYKKKDQEVIAMVENQLNDWLLQPIVC